MKSILLCLFLASSAMGAGLVNGTLSPVPGGTNSSGGSGGATNGIQQLNGTGTNTTLTNATIYGTFTGNGGGITNVNGTNGILNVGIVGGIAPLGTVVATYPLQAAVASYGDNIPYLWFAHNAGVGSNAWGIPVNFPGGITQEGQLWTTNKFINSGNVQKNIYMNGGPTGSSLTNGYPSGTNVAAADSYVRIHNINPFATGPSLGLVAYTTNVTNFAGSTYSAIVGTNIDGVIIRQMDPFGEAFVWTPDTSLVGEKDQAGVMTWLAGIGPWDQAIGGNYQIGAESSPSQHATFYAFNSGPRRTDGTGTPGEWHVGMPLQIANVQMPTNSNWKWALDVDEIKGNVAITNGTTTLTNAIILRTNDALRVGGAPAGGTGVFNVAGNAVFNLVPNPGAFNNGSLVTFAYQNTSYLGIGGYGSGVKANPGIVTLTGRELPFYWSDGGGGDLQTRLTLQTWTKLGGFDANGDWGVTNNERVHGTATFDGNTKFSGNGGSTLGYYPTATDSSGNWTWQAVAGGTFRGDPLSFATNNSTVILQNPLSVTNITMLGQLILSNTVASSSNQLFINPNGTNFVNVAMNLGIDSTSNGITLTNISLATVGHQEYSPAIHLGGQGWKTTATAGSQPVDSLIYLKPVQGAANPTAQINFDFSINNVSYANAASLASSGLFSAAGVLSSGNITAGGSSSIAFLSRSTISSSVDGTIAFKNNAGTAVAGILGTTAANDAAAGNLGETVTSAVAVGGAGGLSTATASNVTSISLTAGDWDVEGNVNFSTTTATVTGASAGISTTTGTLPTDGTEAYSGVQLVTTSAIDSVTAPRKRINVSGTTTVYLVGKSTFSVGNVAVFGSMTARRIR